MIFEFPDSSPGYRSCRPCRVKITVKAKQYSCGKEVYDITYKYCNKNGWNMKDDIQSHPMFNITQPSGTDMYTGISVFGEADPGGVIVAKNPMTNAMIDMLMMPYEEMEPFTGLTIPSDYKKQIIKMLSQLWD